LVDPGALTQIFLNLLDNAVKYGPEGQVVTVCVRRSADEIVLSVDDEGPGIPVADRRRVFDAFERLDRLGAPKTSGAGIGLTVVRDLAVAHSGRAWVEAAPGGGARVAVALPAAIAPPSPVEPASSGAADSERELQASGAAGV
jgi:signal transduction histidine kinase